MYFNAPSTKWLIAVLFVALHCKSVDSASDPEKELQKLLVDNVGRDYTTVLNASKTFILCIQNIPATKVGKIYVNYLVVELANNRIAVKGKFLNGHCQWNNDSSIEVVDMPGAIKENQSSLDFKKIISIKNPKL
jgi:hypothetical protein